MKGFLFKRFNDMSADDLMMDMHIHSTWTDGENTVQEIIIQAETSRLKNIAVTDHVRNTSTYCPDFTGEVNRLKSETEIGVFPGFEAKLKDFDGNLDIPEFCIKDEHLIIGSVHSLPQNGKFVLPTELASHELVQDLEYKLTLGLISSQQADVLGHVGGMSLAVFGSFSFEYLEKIISAAAETQIAFELNLRYHSEIISELMELFQKYDPFVSIGSDAHNIKEIGSKTEIVIEHFKRIKNNTGRQ